MRAKTFCVISGDGGRVILHLYSVQSLERIRRSKTSAKIAGMVAVLRVVLNFAD